jgi:hypothetical protein
VRHAPSARATPRHATPRHTSSDKYYAEQKRVPFFRTV